MLCADLLAAQPSAAMQLQTLLKGIHSMRANFNQTVLNESKAIIQSASGNFELVKPNLLRWQVIQPESTLLVINGKKMWNYDVELAQVTVQNYSTNTELSPLSFMIDDVQRIPFNFNVNTQAGGCFDLQPKRENQNFASLQVCFAGKQISKVQLIDHLGQTSMFVFSKIHNNVHIARERFNFTPPAGTDVIGEQ